MRALIVVDLQNDFCPGGALAVPHGNAIVAAVNRLMSQVDVVVATQDWHPAEHRSFAVNNPGLSAYSMGVLAGQPQVMWPTHCVQWTGGACFHPALDTAHIANIFPKGTDPFLDSYSGFFDNGVVDGQRKSTGLGAWLQTHHIQDVLICGLATDYCVKATAIDAVKLGLRTTLIEDACRGVELTPGDSAQAISAMRQAGVQIRHEVEL